MEDRCGLSALLTDLNETVEKIDATLNGQSRAWVNVQPCVMCSSMALCQAVVIQQKHIAALEEKVKALSTGMETLIQDAKLKEKRYKRDQIVGERQWDSVKSYIERLSPDQSKKSLCQDELLCSLSPHSPDRYLEPKNLSISKIELGFCGEHQKDHLNGAHNGKTAKREEAKENIRGSTVAIESVVQNHMHFVPEHSKWVYCGSTNNSSLGSLILSWDFQTLTINNETNVYTSPGKCLRSKCFWWHSKSRVVVLKDGLYRVTAGIYNQNSVGLVSSLENSGNSSLITVYVNGKGTTRSSIFQNSSNAKKTIHSDRRKNNSCSPVVSSSIVVVAQNSLVEFRLEPGNDIVEISRCFLEMEFIV